MRAVIARGLLALFAIVAVSCETIPDYPNKPLAAGAANPPPADLIGSDPGAPLILIAFSGGGSRAAALGLGVLYELGAHTYPGQRDTGGADRSGQGRLLGLGRQCRRRLVWPGRLDPARRAEDRQIGRASCRE